MASGIKSAATGSILLVVAAFMTLILAVIALFNDTVGAQLWYIITGAAGTFILLIGALLVSLGVKKLGKLYENAFTGIVGILGLVFSIIGIVATVLVLVSNFVPVLAGVAGIMGIILTPVLLGVFFILFGVALIILRDKTGFTGLTLATGILGIIAGAFWCSILLVIIGMIMLIILGILAAYLFLKAKGLPAEEAKEEIEEEAKEVKGAKVKEAKKLVVRPAEEKKPALKPEEIEEEVLKWVKKHPDGLDVAECAGKLGASEKDVEKAVNALVKKGKLAMG